MYDTRIDTRSVYIHWPFCPYKCHFCPFVALASQDQFMGVYHEALKKEIKQFARQSGKLELDTIFIGGGTPSTYPDDLLLDTFGILEEVFTFNKNTSEITLEVNPGTVRPEQLHVWKKAGINRLSVGVQSLNDKVLHSLNRLQSGKDVYWLLGEAKELFTNISVDLIMGLPGISLQEWKDLITALAQWPITHVSVYFLTVHEDTPLYFKVKTNAVALSGDDVMADTYSWTVDALAEYGFMQYELSNFAKAGFQSRHNSVYWERKPYKAFGLGACSFDGTQRLQNQKNLTKYMSALEEGKDVTVFNETLSKEQIYLERMMLGLRRATGVSFDEITKELDEEHKQRVFNEVALLRKHQLLKEHNGRMVLTTAGLSVHNAVTVRLLQASGCDAR